MRVTSFPPVFRADARVLILGSMPGTASLQAEQYYAHARNQFWPIMAELAQAGPELLYAERLLRLQQRGIAIWDVLASCERVGSLDTAINANTLQVNDLPGLIGQLPALKRVLFNGAAAQSVFARHWRSTAVFAAGIEFRRLPSTSPAHAAMNFESKLASWRGAIADGTISRPTT